MKKKEIAADFLKMVSLGSVQEAFEKYVHSEFKHHNAYFKGDRKTLMEEMKRNYLEMPNKTYEVLRAVEEKDLVTIHGKVSNVFNKNWSVIHIFRFEDDKIVEEWEASQEDLIDSPNENGIF